jgi:hypothetical protein
MVPILATSSRQVRAQAEALEHCAFLLKRIVIALAAAESVSEVLVVQIAMTAGERSLGMDAFQASLGIDSQVAGARGRHARSTAVAGKIPLVEDLYERVVAMALNRACVTDAGCLISVAGILGGWVARQAREDALSKGS